MTARQADTTNVRSTADFAGASTTSRIDLPLSVTIAVIWAVLLGWQLLGEWSIDLSALWMAGHLWQTGQASLIYAPAAEDLARTVPEWEGIQQGLGLQAKIIAPYIYPPLWAVLLGLVAGILSPQAFLDAGAALNVSMLAAMPFLTARLIRPKGLPLAIWVTASLVAILITMPGFQAINLNQPTILTAFLTLCAMVRLEQGHDRSAGILLAVAAAIKILPVLVAFVFLLDRRWRALAAFGLTCTALGAASIALAGPGLNLDFIAAAQHETSRILLASFNSTLRTAVVLLVNAAGVIPPLDLSLDMQRVPALPLAEAGQKLAFLMLLGLVWFRLSPLPPGERRIRGLLTITIAAPLFAPLGWQHYFLLPMLLTPALLIWLPRGMASLFVAIVAAFLTSTVFVLMTITTNHTAAYIWAFCGLWLGVLAAAILPRARMPAPDN